MSPSSGQIPYPESFLLGRLRLRVWLAALAGLCVGGVSAEEATRGFDAGLSLTLEASAGLRGGADQGRATQALTIGHIGWQSPAHGERDFGVQVYASVLNHAGDGPTERFLGDFLAASNMEAYSSTRLYSWFSEVTRGDMSLRAGALLADEEFAGTTGGGEFINSSFGWPAFISANTVNTGPAFYAAALGVRVAQAVTPALTWRTGLYDGDTFDSADGDPHLNRHGLHYRLGGTQGWFVISEVAWAPPEAKTRWKLGAWRHTATFADQYADASGRPFAVTGADPRQHSGNFGSYAVIERILRGTAGQPGYIDSFVRLGVAPADRNVLAWTLDAGVSVLGLLPNRPDDTLALGFARAEFSDRFAATAQLLDPTVPSCDAEQVWELSYTFGVIDHVACKPDLQFIRHPGGRAAPSDAILVSLRVLVDF